MMLETSIAVKYILSHLYTKLPRRRVDCFGEELEKFFHAKFQHHWYPSEPSKDADFRCVNASGPQVDLIFPEAASVSGLEWNEIQTCLPDGLIISVDPGHVACQYNQQNYPNQDFGRYGSTTGWPSASISLSSSGCSSASSSISSSNVTPNSQQIAHQVLYCYQDSWPASNNQQWTDGSTNAGTTAVKMGACDQEPNDNLATATALSVLLDSEDYLGSNRNLDAVRNQKQDSNQLNKLWGQEFLGPPGIGQDACLVYPQRDTGFSSMDSSKTELNSSEMKPNNMQFSWNIPTDNEGDHNLLSMLNAEVPELTDPNDQTGLLRDRTQLLPLLNRSASNPPQADQSQHLHQQTLTGYTENMIPQPGSHISPSLMNGLQSKFDRDPTLHVQRTSRLSSTFTQPITGLTAVSAHHHFVQKSTSTPSFTAATFAQTKFGSTKLKNQSKRTTSRILSPTTVQPNFSGINSTAGLAPLDSITSVNLGGPGNRSSAGAPTDMSAFQRFVPLVPFDLNAIQSNNHNHSSDKQSLLSPELTLAVMDEESPSMLPMDESPSGGRHYPFSMPYQHRPQQQLQLTQKMSSNNHLIGQTARLEDLFACHVEDVEGETMLGKFGVPETTAMPLDMISNPYWPPCNNLRSFGGAPGFPTLPTLTTASEWNQHPIPTDCIGEKSICTNKMTSNLTSIASNACTNLGLVMNGMGSSEVDEQNTLHDDSLLSNRMVNMLLEEENVNDGDCSGESNTSGLNMGLYEAINIPPMITMMGKEELANTARFIDMIPENVPNLGENVLVDSV